MGLISTCQFGRGRLAYLVEVFNHQAQVSDDCGKPLDRSSWSLLRQNHLPSTITIRFRNPRKLGISVASWLRTVVWGREWTAATCLYFFFMRRRRLTSGTSMAGTFVELIGVWALRARPLERADRLERVELTAVMVSTVVAIIASLGGVSYQNCVDGHVYAVYIRRAEVVDNVICLIYRKPRQNLDQRKDQGSGEIGSNIDLGKEWRRGRRRWG